MSIDLFDCANGRFSFRPTLGDTPCGSSSTMSQQARERFAAKPSALRFGLHPTGLGTHGSKGVREKLAGGPAVTSKVPDLGY